MENIAEIIRLSKTDTYIPKVERDAFLVNSGTVIIYIAPINEDLSTGRRILLCEAEKGIWIPSFVYRDYENKQWRFIFTAKENAELTKWPGSATDRLREGFLENIFRENEGIVSKKEGFNEAIKEIYTRKMLEEDIFIGKGKKDKEDIEIKSSELIKKSFSTDEERIEGSIHLYKTVAIACHASKIPILSQEKLVAMYGEDLLLQDIASASHFAYREVVLEQDWYRKDCGTLIANIDGSPVACIPRGQNSYYIYRADTGKEELTAEIANTVYPKAYSISRALPAKSISGKELFSFAMQSIRRADFAMVAILGLLGALIGILIPTLNQKIYDDYIPLGEYSQLIQLCMVIATFMLSSLFFDMVKNLSEFRISSRVGYDLQNAVYFRVFRLPESFLRKQESADLAQRIAAIPVLAKQLVESTLVSGLGLVFACLYLYKMFKYAKKLAWFSVLLLILYGIIVFFIATKTIRHSREIQIQKGAASGKLYQFINGVDKLRMAGAEERATYQYLIPFSRIQVEEGKKNRYAAFISMLSGGAATIFSMVFFFLIVKKNLELSTGNFMAFNSAFGSFSAAFLQLVESGVAIYQLKPLYNRILPIVKTPEEVDSDSEMVDRLKGNVSLKNVSFAYESDAPNVLNGISLEIKSGEYIGIVGSSGCGKSTLLKLLLGFETPTKGQVCYDGKDIRGLNKRELRKNLGVVLQNGQLIAGSIRENITITAPKARLADVNKAVIAVGLEEDIAQMPMGLDTMMSETSGTVSGGQKQRILIARAIINNPSILIFDEATSALDNLTQAHVCESLDKMKVTRIVVAHRLSTIKNCDRIIVLDKGRIAEEGSYEQLMELGGLFKQLALRQLVD